MESLPIEMRNLAEATLPDGLYALQCRNDASETRGVIHKSGIRIYGGGECFACFGTMLTQGDAVSAQLEVQQETHDGRTAFGSADHAIFRLTGSTSPYGADLHGNNIEDLDCSLSVALRLLRG